MTRKGVVLGGGIAGLSAAHELSERGFAVSVYERRPVAGGKARSEWVRGSGTEGRLDLPGEHGFRFFPRFYRHLPDTMKRIPYAGNPQGVYDNLIEGRRTLVTEDGQRPVTVPSRFPRSLSDLEELIIGSIELEAQFRDPDSRFLLQRMWQIATSCEERKLAEYEKIAWWDFIDAARRDAAYQQFASMVRITVAADPHTADARTQGNMGLQMMFALSEPGISNDRLLNGPTSLVWIDPWVAHLRQRGVEFHFRAPLEAIHCDGGRIQHVTVRENDQPVDVTADYYLVCLPVEVLARLLAGDRYEDESGEVHYRNVLAADPTLAGILTLGRNVDWMNGIQFFLKRDVAITPGHAMYLDTPWALTSVSQHQFWPHVDLSRYGDGTVEGILSVDISNWHAPGIVSGKTADECTIDEIAKEVWAQLKQVLNAPGQELLRDEDLHSYHVDTDIEYHQVPSAHDIDSEPLLINKAATWHLRPGAFTAIPNLFLAGDYVRTNTQLATMEAANEAARRAVNAIIAASGSSAPLCKIWSLHDPAPLKLWQWYDRWRFARGLPWRGEIPPAIRLGQDLLNLLSHIWRAAQGLRHPPTNHKGGRS